MASILNEYLSKRLGLLDLQNELQRLIKAYNKHTGRYMFIYAADINKARNRGIDVSLVQDDFYNIQDILRESSQKKIDFYIETPGGSGEAAEEIAKFLRKKFEEVNFVIAGEAKSAGTVLVLSGDNIYMTDTGSLGPIDAQVKIGRSVVSAHDYKEWVSLKREEAAKVGSLNPFDAVMVAQISPGELYGVINSLEFAKDLVKVWLEKYKFKNWTETKTSKKPVTAEMRKKRAHEVAEMFCDHTTWRTHGRSLKIEDLKEVLLIERIDDDKALDDIVYRIKTVIRLLLDGSSVYKLFFFFFLKISKTFTVSPLGNIPIPNPFTQAKGQQKSIDAVELDIQCPKCHKRHQVNGYMDISSQDIQTRKLKVNPNVKDNDILVCDNCNFALDLKPIKNQVESQTRRKISFK
ncbi:MAG: ATP-dependent Clp protease proteolytic subunit [Bacteroidetes bacterium]|nr:ATP-dependent Clp protease proteolytic subunit [Bacteroidota bacterium]